MNTTPSTLLRTAVLAALLALAANPGLAQTLFNVNNPIPDGTATRGDGPFTVGTAFVVGAEPVVVNELGVMDVNGDGYYAPVSVGLWNEDGRVLLGSVTVTGSDALIGYSRYHALTAPVTLSANTTYLIGARVGAGIEWFLDSWPNDLVTPNPRITILESRYATGDALAAPTSSGGASARWCPANAALVTSDPDVKPTISSEPQGATRLLGDSVLLSVLADGTPRPTYQWFKQPAVLLEGATNSALSMTNLQLSDSGDYFVIVTNRAGSITSNPALLTVIDPPVDLTSDLRLWLRFDESSGLVAQDSSGANHNGELQGFAGDNSQWVAGRLSGAIQLKSDAVSGSNFVMVADNGDLDVSTSLEFSLSAWVKGPATQKDGAAIIAKGTGNGGEQYALDVYAGKVRFYCATGSGFYVLASTNLLDNTWQHVAAVFSVPLNRMKLYVNSAEVASSPLPSHIVQNTHELTIGSRQSGSEAYDLNFSGRLDDVRVYARALTPADVQAVFASAPVWAPAVAEQPRSADIYPCDTLVLRVAADGTPPLTYQWEKNGAPIAGATQTTLGIIGAQASDAGTYRVMITNSSGFAVSDLAVVTVHPQNEGRLFSDLLPLSSRGDFSGTIGNRFVVGSHELLVTALGYEDAGRDGLNGAHRVGLWDVNGVELASVTVPSGTVAPLQGAWRYATLPQSAVLTAGTTYFIGAEVIGFDGDGWSDQSPVPSATACQAAVNMATYGIGNFVGPVNDGGGASVLRWTPANMQFQIALPSALRVVRNGGQVTLSWDASATGWTLDSASALVGQTWLPVDGVSGNAVTITLPATGQSFFRLRK